MRPAPPRGRGLSRRLSRRLAGLGLVLLVGSAVLVALLTTEPGNQALLRFLLAQANDRLDGATLSVGRLHSDLWDGVVLRRVELTEPDGGVLFSADRVVISWDLRGLLHRRLVFGQLRLDHPDVDLGVDAGSGRLRILGALGIPPASGDEPPEAWGGVDGHIVVRAIEVRDGRLRLSEGMVDDLQVDAGVEVQGRRLALSGGRATARLDGPLDGEVGLDIEAVLDEGDLAVERAAIRFEHSTVEIAGAVAAVETAPDLDLSLQAPRLSAADLTQLLGDLGGGVRAELGVRAGLNGPLDDLEGSLIIDAGGAGHLSATATADLLRSPVSWGLQVVGEDLEPSALLVDLAETDAGISSMSMTIDGVGDDYPDDLTAVVRAHAEGIRVAGEAIPSLRAHLALQGGTVVIDELVADHAAGALSIVGELLPLQGRGQLDLRADLASLAALSSLAGRPLAGSGTWTPHLALAWSTGSGSRGPGSEGAESPGFQVAGGGPVDLWDLDIEGAHIGHLEGPLGLSVDGDTVGFHGDSHLETLALARMSVARGRATWKVALPPGGGLDLRAEVQLVDVGGEGWTGSVGRIDGTVDVDASPEGPLEVEGKLWATDLATTAQGPAGSGPIVLSMKAAAWRAELGVRFPSGGDLLVGTLTRSGGTWRIDGLSLSPTPGLSWRSEGPVVVELGAGAAVRADGVLSGPAGRLAVSSDPATGRWRISAADLDLGALAGLQALVQDPAGALEGATTAGPGPAPPPVEGVADLDLALTVAASGVPEELDGSLRVRDLKLPGRVDGLDLRLGVAGVADHPDLAVDAWGDDTLLLTARGSLPLAPDRLDLDCDGDLALELVLPPAELDALRARLPFLPEVAAYLSGDLVATGSPCDPDLRLTGGAELPLGDHGERVRIELQAGRDGGSMQATAYLEEGFTRRVRVEGTAQTALGELLGRLRAGASVDDALTDRLIEEFSIALEPRNVSVESLRAFAALPPGLSGRIGGGLVVSGTPVAPRLQGALLLIEGRIGRVDVSQGGLTIWPDADGYRGRLHLGWEDGVSSAVPRDAAPGRAAATVDAPSTPDGPPRASSAAREFTAEASLPLAPGDTLDDVLDRAALDLRLAGTLPLAAFDGVVDGLSEAEGDLAIDAVVGGSLRSPTVRSALSLDRGAFTWRPLKLRYEDITLRARATERRIELTELFLRDRRRWSSSLRGLSSDRSLTATGQLTLDALRPAELRLHADLDHFWVLGMADRSLLVSGSVEATGRWPALRVDGSLDVNEALMDFGSTLFGADTTLGIDPVIQVWRGGAPVQGGRHAEEEPPAWRRFDLDLDIDLLRNVRLIVDVPTAEDYGEQLAQMSKISLDAELGGAVKLRQRSGALSLQGEIETLRGSSTLLGASFDLRGGTISFLGDGVDNPLVDITAVRSTAYGDVDVHVSGFVDDLDIVPSSEEYPDQLDVVSLLLFGKPASAVTSGDAQTKIDAIGIAMASLTGRIERALGTSVVDELEIDPAGAIRIGKALSDRVFLRLESTTGTARTEGNRTSVTLEYLITQRMYAEFSTGDRGASSASLFWRWRF